MLNENGKPYCGHCNAELTDDNSTHNERIKSGGRRCKKCHGRFYKLNKFRTKDEVEFDRKKRAAERSFRRRKREASKRQRRKEKAERNRMKEEEIGRRKWVTCFYQKIFQPRICVDCGADFETLYPDKISAGCVFKGDVCGVIRCVSCRIKYKNATHVGHKRRCLKYDVPFESFDIYVVFERDRWVCQDCGVSTPEEKRGLNLLDSPELDHVWPLAKVTEDGQKSPGHVISNCQLLCRKCNNVKGNAGAFYKSQEDWRMFLKTGKLDVPEVESTCPVCRVIFIKNRPEVKYCSRKCRRRSYEKRNRKRKYVRKRERILSSRKDIPCVYCEFPFKSIGSRVYCSDSCKQKSQKARYLSRREKLKLQKIYNQSICLICNISFKQERSNGRHCFKCLDVLRSQRQVKSKHIVKNRSSIQGKEVKLTWNKEMKTWSLVPQQEVTP